MKSLIALTLLATSISALAFGAASTASAAPLSTTVTVGLETPTKDCCYDAVNLDRKPPLPRAARGPDCCWDPSNWD